MFAHKSGIFWILLLFESIFFFILFLEVDREKMDIRNSIFADNNSRVCFIHNRADGDLKKDFGCCRSNFYGSR